MLFSATMPRGVHDLALRLTRDAVWIEATPSGTTADGIAEFFYSVKPEKKPDLLLKLVREPGWDQVLIFTRTKAGADVLEGRLQREGIQADVMHSNRQMKHRTRALERFATGKVRVLVATDVAQRGLDVEGISHVVNYDVPLDPEDYVHRIGRTGRAGATGNAVTLVTASDLGALKSLEQPLGSKRGEDSPSRVRLRGNTSDRVAFGHTTREKVPVAPRHGFQGRRRVDARRTGRAAQPRFLIPPFPTGAPRPWSRPSR